MNCAALGLGAALSTLSPAFGQITPPGTVRVSSNFTISQTVKANDTAAIDNAEESGRKIVYERAGQECKLLLETLATTCKLQSLNVFANIQNHQFRGDSGDVDINTNGSAQFWITTKN